jgi:predicted RecA/RadA family phage recombinase
MKVFSQVGDVLPFTAAATLASGAGVKLGGLVGIVQGDVANGAQGQAAVKGVFTVPTDTGTAWNDFDTVYWDNTAKNFTKTSTSNTKCGVVVGGGKTSGATTAQVKLVPCL